MKQKYTILKDAQNHQLIIREYAQLDKQVLSLLCEESYADERIESVIASGKASLISTLRTKNLYPPVIYAGKIADAVMALYASADQESIDLFFDDVELLAQEPPSENGTLTAEDNSSGIEEMLLDRRRSRSCDAASG